MTPRQKLAAAVLAGLALASGVATNEGGKIDGGDRSIKGCVAAPNDGGTDCKRLQPGTKFDRAMNGPRYFGAGNSFPAREAVGPCESMPPKSCAGGE